jgi:hypothetical protein
VTSAPALSRECLDWVKIAGYTCFADRGSGRTVLVGPPGGSRARFSLRQPAVGRVQLLEIDDHDTEHLTLHATAVAVLERFVVALLGDEIREDLGLPYLDLPWAPEHTAPGFVLSEMARGFRILSRVGAGPVAAARDATLSLVKLVPLSQFMMLDLPALKRSFLDENGAPCWLTAPMLARARAVRWGETALSEPDLLFCAARSFHTWAVRDVTRAS